MSKKLNVAMIGGGFMGKAHAAAYAAMPMFFWPAPAIPVRKVVVDINEKLAEDARQRFGFEEASSNWREVIARPDIDIIDIVTPNDSHPEIAIAAAKAGKHIICEKPLARTAEESKQMLDAVNASGVIHMVAFNYRRTPAVALARRFIEQGRIGEILNFRGTYLQDWSADENGPLSWRFSKKIAGSGAVGDIEPDEAEGRVSGQACEPAFLEADSVVIVEIVDADDLIAAGQQNLAGVHADKTGGTGNEDFHERGDDPDCWVRDSQSRARATGAEQAAVRPLIFACGSCRVNPRNNLSVPSVTTRYTLHSPSAMPTP